LCALEDVVRCWTSIPPCTTGELPAMVPGECCPTCVPPRPTCTCPSDQICVYPRDPTAAAVCFPKTCVTITIVAAPNNTNALTGVTSDELKFLLFEMVARWCDQNQNGLLCRRRDNQIRNTDITGVQNADGSYSVTVCYPINLADNQPGDTGVPVMTTSAANGQSIAGMVAMAAANARRNHFAVFDATDPNANNDIYIDAAADAEASAGYTATGGSNGSDAHAVIPSAVLLLATVAAVLAVRRF